ncbi:MAG TPA: DUF805 domain-containing protein [Candidatus Avipropionibacterium avicola]|uniref:DUF805 domain-containing protein n=1 Tax=Candidatus Avipropionibacterium avicola TaxID=2840701 RepID=A0A9D1GYC8_9ACTN|nr:DUF805 domain-containing protein [Candidatus Avipropionibacterium avicola]
MQPIDAIKSCFRQYVGFSGRARRSEFWWWFLFSAIVGVIGSIIDNLLGFGASNVSSGDGSFSASSTAGPVSGILGLALLLPSIAVAVRRLHDTTKSGWFYLLYLIPCVGFILYIVFNVKDSDPDNQYGPSPKNPGAQGGYPGGAPGGYPGAPGAGGPTYQ